MLPAVLLLWVATVAVLSGCGGVPGDPDPRGTPAEHGVTPVPLPGATPSPAARDVPREPESRALAPEALEALEAEEVLGITRATLSNRSVTVSVERTVHAGQETHVKNVTTLVGADRGRYHTRSIRTGPGAPPDRYVWADGERLEYRLLAGGAVVERITLERDRRPDPLERAGVAGLPLSLVFDLAVDVEVQARDDGARLTADLRPDDRLTTGAVTAPRGASLEADLGPDGFVERYRVRLEANRHDRPVILTYEAAFVDVGATEAPPVPGTDGSSTTPTQTPTSGT